MPITNQQFNSGLDDLPQRILDFLQNNKANGAYSVYEIMNGLGWNEAKTNIVASVFVSMGFGQYLKDMASKKMIEAKTISGQEYYRAK
jgi:hypothetical protein